MPHARSQVEIPIAILGMGCRLPGAANLDEYWRMLESGASPIAEIPSERFNERLYFDPRKGVRGKSYSKLAGLLADREFNRAACPIPLELERSADNAHLLMCEVAAAACRDAGLDPFDLPYRNTGVFIGHAQGSDLAGELTLGACIDEAAQFLREVQGFDKLPIEDQNTIVEELIAAIRDRVPRREADSPDPSIAMVAGVIAKAFGLDGPYLAINSACASSLQAIQLAARALQSGRIDMAIAGGASDCKEGSVVLFSHAQSMSATGSRPFDEQADGLVIAEGYAAVVLKTLPRALADGDRIQGLITGIGCSSDGKGKSLWAPRKEGQIKAMERAYAHGLDMSTLQYVEAHATSTSLGDATELSALAEVLSAKFPAGKKIPVTSVKANIGHALEAAGVAGLIKTVLCMQRRTIVSAINIDALNAKIDWERAPIFIPRENLAWPSPAPGEPRRAAVNAFGIGGLNMHVVVEELTETQRAKWSRASGHGDSADNVGGGKRSDAAMSGANGAAMAEAATDDDSAVAVIGRGCIFPGAPHVSGYWELIRSDRDPKGPTPADRWRSDLALRPRTKSTRQLPTTRGGYITDFVYDWQKHKVPPKQVQQADPLQFMLLEGAEQALRDAGYDHRPFDRERVAVLVGTESGGDFGTQLCVSLRLPEIEELIAERLRARGIDAQQAARIAEQYGETLLKNWPALIDESGSFSTSTLASRITKTMNLMGGAAAIDAGDASSAAALAASVDLLLAGDCDLAICAGGQRCMNFPKYEGLQLAGALADAEQPAPPFDAAARGILPGEGVGVVLLKRLAEARRDGDPIHAIVRGVGAAHDANPRLALTKAIERAAADAGINLASVAVVEAAGVADESVDAEHIAALAAVYGQSPRQRPLLLSTVTGQIGHTIGASAMASLLKASLEIEHGEAPRVWGLSRPSAAFAASSGIVRPAVVAESIRPDSPHERCFAAVDSIGKGLAYHILLERGQLVAPNRSDSQFSSQRPSAPSAEPPIDPRPVASGAPALRAPASNSPSLDTPVVAGATKAAAIYRFAAVSQRELFAEIERAIAQPPLPESTAFSDADGVRLAIVARGPDELVEKLRATAAQLSNPAAQSLLERQGCFYRVASERRPRVAFLFPGQGSQYAGMLRELSSENPTADAMRQTLDAIMSGMGHRTFTDIAWEHPEQLGADIWITQSSVLMANLMMSAALQSMGIRPDVVAGHSQGEYAALAVAGALDLAATLRAARARCEAIEATPTARGALMATTAPPSVIEPLATALVDRAFMANFNAPDQTVVGGKPATLEILATLLKAQGYQAQMLSVPCPYHTPLMGGAGEALRPALEAIAVRPPRTLFVSTVTNRYVADPTDIRENLVAQLTTPVRYLDLVRQLADEEPTVFVEVGPSRTLTNLNQRILADRGDINIIACDNPKRPGAEQLLHARALLECLRACGDCAPAQAALFTSAPAARQRSRAAVVHIDATEARRERMRRLAAGEPSRVAPAASPSVEASPVSAIPPATASPVAAVAAPTPEPDATDDTTMPAGANSTGADAADLEKFLISFVVEQTGYPPEVVDLDADLEADLGIDSIKKAQLFGELAEYFDARPAEGMTLDDFPTLRHALNFLSGQPTSAPVSNSQTATGAATVAQNNASRTIGSPVAPSRLDTPAASVDALIRSEAPTRGDADDALAGASATSADATREESSADAADLEKFLISFVVEQTGYPPEVVDLDADLEADLGIDSIKKAQLFGELAEYFDARPAEGMTLDDFPTLRHALNFLVGADSKKKAPIDHAETAATAVADQTTIAAVGDASASHEFASAAASAETPAAADLTASSLVAEYSGAPYKIGYAHGERYRAQIVRLLRRFADLADDDVSEAVPLPLDRLSHWFEFDELEELRGVADAVQVPLQNLLAVNVAVGVGGDDARQLAIRLGETRQMPHVAEFSLPIPAGLAECLTPVVSLRRPSVGFAHIAIGYAGIVGSLAGINSHGLIVSSTAARMSRQDRRSLGRGHARLASAALLSATNLEDAAQRFATLSHADNGILCVSHWPTMASKLFRCDGQSITSVDAATAADTSLIEPFRASATTADALAKLDIAERLVVAFDPRDMACYLRAADLPNHIARVDLASLLSRSADEVRDASQGHDAHALIEWASQVSDSSARFVMRMKPAPLPSDAPQAPRLHGAALIVGQNRSADALRDQLSALGATVFQLTQLDDVTSAVGQLESWWQVAPIAHLFVMTEREAGALDPRDVAGWSLRRRLAVEVPFYLAQRWIQLAGEAKLLPGCTFIASTALGGDFGFSERIAAPTGAALAGLAKAIYIEIAYMRNQKSMLAKAIDFPDAESPDRIAERILREWAGGSADFEVAYVGGERRLPYAFPQPATPAETTSIRRGGVWVITGGARGITAECALALGRRFGLRLHLIGSSPPPNVEPQWREMSAGDLKSLKSQVMREARAGGRNMDEAWSSVEKAIEIDRRLREFDAAGVSATYHACDVSDATALAAVLESIRRTSGPIEGIVHGAGIERPCRFERKQRVHVEQTIAIKVDGALNLMRLTWQDPIRHFIGFGSISGRLGSNGQADYCIASDLLCKLARWYRQFRPGVRAVGFHWHSWAEIGMAAKAETAKALEMANGPAAMPKQEGVAHFLRELLGREADGEVLITTWEYHGRYFGTEHHPAPLAATTPTATPPATSAPSADHASAASLAWPRLDFQPIASRYRLVTAPSPLRENVSKRPLAGSAWIIGENRFADELRRQLRLAGLTVEVIAVSESNDAMRADIEQRYARGGPDFVFVATGRDDEAPSSLSAQSWRARKHRGILAPFMILQRLFQLRRQTANRSLLTIAAATSLGGDFGLSGNVRFADGGALCGLLKSLYIEDSRLNHREVRVKAIDAPSGESPASLAAVVLRELQADDPVIEVAWSAGARSILRSINEPVETLPRRSLPRGGNWVVTGGARGITAAVAMELATRYGVNLSLIGRSPAPRSDAPWRNATPERLAEIKAQIVRESLAAGQPVESRWEPIRADIEVFETLQRFRDAGVDATYYSCDLADWDRLDAILAEIRATGPIEGVVHGAGYGKSGRFDTRPADNVARVLAGKIDGAVALMSLTRRDPIKYWIGFGSISGRFGGNGLADYAAANDMLAKLVDQFATERTDCAACCFHWQSWDEVGMAMIGDSAAGTKNILKMKFISPREGIEHFCREIEAGLPASEVLITDGFFEKTFYPQSPSPHESDLQDMPLLAAVSPVAISDNGADHSHRERRAWMGEIVFDPTNDPFLRDHRLREKPLLPAVVGIEAMAEAATLASGKRAIALRDIRFLRGVRFSRGEPSSLRVLAELTTEQRYDCRLISDFRGRGGKVLERDRLHFSAFVEVETAPEPQIDSPDQGHSSTQRPYPPSPDAWHPFQYPEDGPMFHGPTLRGLAELSFAADEGWARIAALPLAGLGGVGRGKNWLTPAVLIDAAFYACGVYLWHCVEQATALPAAIQAVRLGRMPRDREDCLAHFRFRGRETTAATFDFTIFGDSGEMIVDVEGYRCEMLKNPSATERSA